MGIAMEHNKDNALLLIVLRTAVITCFRIMHLLIKPSAFIRVYTSAFDRAGWLLAAKMPLLKARPKVGLLGHGLWPWLLTGTCIYAMNSFAQTSDFFESPGASGQTSGKGINFVGSPIEKFSVTSAEVRSVLKQLSEYSGVDFVLHDKVNGKISITVTHKTWKEILSIVCRVANLSVIRESSYIYIIPTDEYQKEVLTSATAEQQAQVVEMLKREVVRLKNVAAAEMQQSISSLLSPRGKITVVQHSNSLIIFDTDKNIEAIKNTIKELDIETDQVSISCKIIQVGSSVIQSLGVQWGYFDQINGKGISATHIPGTGVVAGALEKLSYGILSQDKLAFTLEYLFQNGKTEMVAQPQITTMDNKEAKIFMGSEVPVTYRDESFNTVVKMITAGTELVVTPHITGDKRLMLDLKPKKSSYTMSNNQPVVTTQSAQTNVVVTDGETVVIAGLTSNEFANTEDGIPILKDIPLIGNLFKRTKKTLEKQDLIVFVTPHIINKKVESISAENALPKTQPSNAK
jgi:type IV pilus assembly protein PilQ